MKRLNKDDAIYIISQMFALIGEPFDRSKLEYDDEWYLNYSWTEEQQEEFKEWLISHLRANFKHTKALAISNAGWFIFMYGFTIRKD